MLANAYDFYTAFREHEWNLFEWNVRLQLLRSPINRRIVSTLQGSKSRKSFHHYNNGILITCRNYELNRHNKRIRLTGPQIINGCQTVRSICEAYESLSPTEQSHFREHTKVQVKIIRTTEPEFIGELVISTNDQNQMNPRNLKSNTVEQRDIQKCFRDLPAKWFYQRKDGEFNSLQIASRHVRWFRKSDYAITGNRKFRLIDNQELAKAWYAFIGYSDQALRGGIDYFKDEKGIYSLVFRRTPSQELWNMFSTPLFTPDEQYFQPGSPNVYQFLLAHGIGKIIDGRRISYKANRNEAIKRGIAKGDLQGSVETGISTSSSIEINNYLTTDIEYFINNMVNNMRELMIEFYSFILSQKYAGCDAIVSQRILCSMPKEKEYYDNGFSPDYLPDSTQDGQSILGPIYGFLKDCISQYFFKYSAEIKAAPRLKSYFWQRNTVNKFRQEIYDRDKAIIGYDQSWKTINKTFLESLPNIQLS